MVWNNFLHWPSQYPLAKSIDSYFMFDKRDSYVSMGALSLLIDVALLLIPIFLVWRLKTAPREKLQLTMLFSFGGLVCIFSLLRFGPFKPYFASNISSLETIWTILELDLTIVCASLVLMKPLMRTWQTPFICSRRRSSTPSTTDSEHFLRQWPYKRGSSVFSRDVCSQLCSHAYPTPPTEMCMDQTKMDVGQIMVSTSIACDVQDRETVLASILGDTTSMVESDWDGSSRRQSIAFTTPGF